MDTMRERVAGELRAILARRRISSAEAGRRLGWSQSYMARRIDGRNALDVDDLEQLHKMLDIDVIEVLRRAASTEVTTYSTTPVAPHAVDVRSPRSRARSRFAQAAAA